MDPMTQALAIFCCREREFLGIFVKWYNKYFLPICEVQGMEEEEWWDEENDKKEEWANV